MPRAHHCCPFQTILQYYLPAMQARSHQSSINLFSPNPHASREAATSVETQTFSKQSTHRIPICPEVRHDCPAHRTPSCPVSTMHSHSGFSRSDCALGLRRRVRARAVASTAPAGCAKAAHAGPCAPQVPSALLLFDGTPPEQPAPPGSWTAGPPHRRFAVRALSCPDRGEAYQ